MKFSRTFAFAPLVTLATLSLALAASAQGADRRSQSIQSSPELVTFLETLSEVASGGGSLAYFGWSENAATALTEDCSLLSGKEVVAQFEQLAKDIIEAGEGAGVTLDPAAIAGFERVIGEGRYEVCYASGCGNRACSNETEYRSLDTGYKIRFELGFED